MSIDLNKLVTSIQGLSTNENDLKNLRTQLTKAEEALAAKSAVLDEALSVLDPHHHSLGYLFILAAKATAPKVDAQRFIHQIRIFLQQANPNQLRLAIPKLSKVCRRFTELLVEVRQPMRGILPLKAALAAVSDDSKYLTPIHTDIVQLCLLAKSYRTAVNIIDEELYGINQDATGLQPKDLLCYYYYGGRVYIGMKQYKKALEFFKMVFTAPALVLSAIMVEAYKKFVLVSLIAHGQVATIPKHTSAVVHRHIKNICVPYQEFATSFATQSTEDAHKCASNHAEVFQKDGNFGLVKQCIQALSRSNIKRNTQTYLTLSLGDLATSSKLSSVGEVESTLLKMIEEGEIFAQINQKDGMVAFQEDTETYSTNHMMGHLDAQINRMMSLDKRIRGVDESIALTPIYVQRTTQSDKGKWGEIDDLAFQDYGKI